MKRLICFLLFTIFLLSACKKKDSDTPTQPKILVSKVIHSVLGNYEFSYDAENKLISETFISANESLNPSRTSTYIYDGQNRVAGGTIDYNDPGRHDSRFTYSYNSNGKVEFEQYFDATNDSLNNYLITTYPNNQQIIINTFRGNGTLSFSEVYKLTNDYENIEEIKVYSGMNGTGTLQSTTTYSNINSTIKNYEILFPTGYLGSFPIGQNVAGKRVISPSSGTAITFNFTYEANADGYMTKLINSSGTTQITVEYIKK